MSGSKLDRENMKKYFRTCKAYPESWEPENSEQRLLYIQQRVDVIELTKPKGRIVLDAGTGKGRFAIAFARAGAEKVIAIDVSKEMLAIARKRAESAGVADKITFELGDVERLNCKDAFFDIVCCMETFVHLSNPQKAMNELARVCGSLGVVVCNVTNSSPVWKWIYTQNYLKKAMGITRPIFRWRPLYPLGLLVYESFCTLFGRLKPPPTREYSKDEFLALCKNAGLNVEKVLEYGVPVPMFFLVLGRK